LPVSTGAPEFFGFSDKNLKRGAVDDSSAISIAYARTAVSRLKDPAVASAGAYIGAGGATSTENQGRVFIALKSAQRPPINQVMARLNREVSAISGVRLFMQAVQDINIGGRLTAAQYQYTLTDTDLSELNQWGPIVMNALAKLPQLTDVTSDQQSSGPQLTLSIDRDAASRLGITASTIDNTLYDAFGQRPIAQVYTRLSQYYVIEQVDSQFQLGPDALKRIYIASQTSGMVPLSELVTLHSTTAPLAVNNQGNSRQ